MNLNDDACQDLISVIVPVYNIEKYLDKCIASIVSQTYQRLEIILVDDGSTDRCGEICDRWAEKDRRIQVIHKTNGGLSDARNSGLNAAKGEYIGFVDGDDYIHSDMYQKLIEIIKGYDADLVICGVEHVDENGVTLKRKGAELGDGLIDNKVALSGVLYKGWTCVVWNKLYRNSLFQHIRFPYGKLYEDRMIMPLIIDRSNRIVTISDNLYNYVHSSNSITRSKSSMEKFDFIEACFLNLKFCEKYYADLSQGLAIHMMEQYLLIRNQVGKVPTKDRERMREVKRMVRYCLTKYGKQIRFWQKLDFVCPSLCYFLLHAKRRIMRTIKL